MGSVDIPPFLREKMKQKVQQQKNGADVPPFLKKKIETDGISDVLTTSAPSTLQSSGGEIEGLSKPFPNRQTNIPSVFPSYKDAPDTIPPEPLNVANFNKQFEDVTGYRDFSLSEPTKSTGLRGLLTDDTYNKRQEAFEQKKFKTYSKEKDKIDKISAKIYFGDIQPKELSELQQNPISRNIANNIIKEYVPEITDVQDGNPATIELATKRIKEKNRINFVNAESQGIGELDNTVKSLISSYNKADESDDIKELKSTLDIDDFNNNDKIGNAISRIKQIERLEKLYYEGEVLRQTPQLKEERETSSQKNKEILEKLTERLNYNVSRKGVSPSLNWIDDRIGQSFISKLSESDKGETVTDKVDKDKLKLHQFKLGLTAIEKLDPVLFKNVTGTIANKKTVDSGDYTVISNIGQEIDNVARFRGGAYNPELIDSETKFDYTTFDQKVSFASAQIGEWMKEKGYVNLGQFDSKLINQAAKETGVDNKEVIKTIIFNEQLLGYDQIPKSGWQQKVVGGFMQPIEGIVSTINTINESPAETYLRSKSLTSGFLGTAKVPNEKGEYSNILPSDRGKFSTDMFRGLGQFVPQILLTKGVGAGLRGVTGLSGIATTASQTKNIADIGGTWVSTFVQTYGKAYEEHLQKTGDENTASLMGVIDGTVSAGFEAFILPDIKIAEAAFRGLKSGLANDLVDLIKKGGNPAELSTKARPFIQKFFEKVTKIEIQENAEELGTQYVGFVTETIFDPASAKDRNINKELWDTFKSTTAAMLLPSILGAGGGSFTKDFTTKSLHSAAINFDSYKESLQKSLDKEYISQDVFNKSVQVLSTHRESIANAPEINSVGKELTPEKILDYAMEDTKIKYYIEQEKKSSGNVAKEYWNEKIKESEDIQRKILLPNENKPTETIEIASKENIPEEKTKGAAIILSQNTPKPNIIEIKPAEVKTEEPIVDEGGVSSKVEGDVKPIRQLGNGQNVYFENDRYRVNDASNGKVLLNIQGEEGGMAIHNADFDSPKEAVQVADKLNQIYPKGVPDAVLIDKVVEGIRKDLKDQPTSQQTVNEVQTQTIKERTPNEIKEITKEIIYEDAQVKIEDIESYVSGKDLPLRDISAISGRTKLRKRLKDIDNIIKCL